MKPLIVILEDDINRMNMFSKKLETKSIYYFYDNVDDCFEFFKDKKDQIDLIFLDHDLDGKVYVDSKEYNTGYTMAKKIKELYGEDYPNVIIHSLNPKGADNILSILTKAQKIPFPVLINSI
jgi:CheY-like chemotaxis protein